MDQRALVVFVILVAVIVLAGAVWILSRRRRSRRLKEHFGPEYDRAVEQRGDRTKAEVELVNREKRVHTLTIQPLLPAARDRFLEEWSAVQRRFVDDPAIAVNDADSLVNRVMVARGYPMGDFEQRAADVSVTHPVVVQSYRAARAIVLRSARGQATTEELRQAMVHYRTLFDELLDTPRADSAGTLQRRAS
jgi:hypothetical protein